MTQAYVSAVNIYPLKSARGISLTYAAVTETGLYQDRQWMLVYAHGDRQNKFITQRDKGCEKLALVEPFFDTSGRIGFLFPNGDAIAPEDIDLSANIKDVEIWNDTCQAHDAGSEAARVFSKYLGIPCRLVKKSEQHPRHVDRNFANESDVVGFADGFPLLVTSESSLATLRPHFSKAQTPIDMSRFRPNIVVAGLKPFQEDIIGCMKIGNDVVIEHMKPCARCKITLVDQSNGMLSGKDPLNTLSVLRKGAGGGLSGAFFGQNAVPRILGAIQIGDAIQILSQKVIHPALENVQLKPE